MWMDIFDISSSILPTICVCSCFIIPICEINEVLCTNCKSAFLIIAQNWKIFLFFLNIWWYTLFHPSVFGSCLITSSLEWGDIFYIAAMIYLYLNIITNGIFIFLQVALKLHALDVQVLLLSQWRLRSSLIDTLEMGAANLKWNFFVAEFEQH
jgi:hypothetical protein